MPLNATVENDLIASFIGAPVPRHNPDDENDRWCVNVYNYFKPAILRLLAFVNEPRNPQHFAPLLNIMRFVRLLHTQDFFQKAANVGLVPGGPFNDDWVERWFDDLFPDEPVLNAYALSVVIQGGEGVNFYSHYKYDNVPTHDTDTRVLVGDHFNYTKTLASMSDPQGMTSKEWMHKYRFFLAFGLQAALDAFHSEVRPLALLGDEPYLSYITTWIDDYQNVTLRIMPSVCGQEFHQWIDDETYDMNNDGFIATLLDITVEVETYEDAFECGILDLFVPYKRPSTEQARYRVGQSDAIFSLFATPQAQSLRMPTNDIVGAGRVPSVDIPLTMPDTIPSFGGITIPIRLLPHGYMLFETLRMLFVSEALGRYHYGNKFVKYKQKLVAMLGTLMDPDISRFIFDQCQGKRAKEPARAERMLGGREPLLLEEARIEEAPKEEKIEPVTPVTANKPKVKFIKPTEEQLEARRYSKELLAMFVKGEELPDPDELTKVQQMGHMDCMSYIYPEMKEFRLPLLPEEREAHKQSSPSITVEMLVEAQLLPADTKLLKKPNKGGKAHKRTTLRKKRHRREPMSRRK
jgi:hypothetical protein